MARREGRLLGEALEHAVNPLAGCTWQTKMRFSGRSKSRKARKQGLGKAGIFTSLALDRILNYEGLGNCETQVLKISFLKFIFSS
jgi:hypothetical protein